MKVPDYDQIVARLRTLKGIAVTCETNVAAGDRGDGDSLEPILNGLVYALSVARGTKVQCVYCDVFNAAGERVERRHLARITKLCGGLTPLDPSSPREAANQRFIERGYELFLKRRVTFCLDVGTIDAYLDAKAEGGLPGDTRCETRRRAGGAQTRSRGEEGRGVRVCSGPEGVREDPEGAT